MEMLDRLLEGVASIGGDDVATRGWVLVGSAGAALLSLAVAVMRRKPKDRVRINADFPAGTRVSIGVDQRSSATTTVAVNEQDEENK